MKGGIKRLGLLVDVKRCIGCLACVVGCKSWHGIPEGSQGRIRVLDRTFGSYPSVSRLILPALCMQCEHPPCAAVCRFSACRRGEDGIVAVDAGRCVGCGLCVLACPYGARVIRTDTLKADGCDLCRDRLSEGKQPLCVEACPGEAFTFGDLNDTESRIRLEIDKTGAEPLLKSYRTAPRVFYKGLDRLSSEHPEIRQALENSLDAGRRQEEPALKADKEERQ